MNPEQVEHDYNTSAYYGPSYIQIRALLNGGFWNLQSDTILGNMLQS